MLEKKNKDSFRICITFRTELWIIFSNIVLFFKWGEKNKQKSCFQQYWKRKKKEKINKNMKIVIFSKNISKIKTFLRKDLRIQYYVCYANFIRIGL